MTLHITKGSRTDKTKCGERSVFSIVKFGKVNLNAVYHAYISIDEIISDKKNTTGESIVTLNSFAESVNVILIKLSKRAKKDKFSIYTCKTDKYLRTESINYKEYKDEILKQYNKLMNEDIFIKSIITRICEFEENGNCS